MRRLPTSPTRRRLVQSLGAIALSGSVQRLLAEAAIGVESDQLPKVGLGTWTTFDVGRDAKLQHACNEVVRHFFARGGRLIDSSPMYGSSQVVTGIALRATGHAESVYAADKIWTSDARTEVQAEQTRLAWGVSVLDLLQVHNLLNWQQHLPTLLQMKAEGRLRHVGITTYGGGPHIEFERVMRKQPLDFVQLTYNIFDREAEQRLLPLAAERGIGVICNRPFRQGGLFNHLRNHPLPPWAADLGCKSWASFLLKFIVSHPAVTCAIPATRQVQHLHENMDAMQGPLPDAAMRNRMASYADAL